ncbi:putative Membrane-associated guanylate kinase, WW and PDZ domain-containing protein 3 [Hypsibius exemplaris]|uniref:Membrane-associated guanylate kinase, WW and PDZ domain-containing protein 3 n=1 Tax=Hypsibius exemplaris TaxID=2072580 RepID=A0A9X6NI32_HYPEX|nr:putative Membrane-associated guanylate kinase, WW and PDZ domain-containing protein 3 [Hypsibius exemplaris]
MSKSQQGRADFPVRSVRVEAKSNFDLGFEWSGGAEYGELFRVTRIKTLDIRYPDVSHEAGWLGCLAGFWFVSCPSEKSPILHKGDVILSVNGKNVSGLCSEQLDWLFAEVATPTSPVLTICVTSLPTVKLREVLKGTYPASTAAAQLQRSVRENLYRFTLACTTRPIRAGEVRGKEYIFLSEEQFQRHEKNGLIIESGKNHGDQQYLYGTVKPGLNLTDRPRETLLEILPRRYSFTDAFDRFNLPQRFYKIS